MSVPRGKLVVLEGIDGAGTTTQMGRLAEHLRATGTPTHVTREPSTGPIGKLIRQMLTGEIDNASRGRTEMMALLFAADRLDHNTGEIEPALARGEWVISDRYDLSSLTYQSAHDGGEGWDRDRIGWIRAQNRFAMRPDVTFVVDVPASIARERRASRGGKDELYEVDALQTRLAEAYLRAEELVPSDTVIHIDGSVSIDDVTAALVRALDAWRAGS